MARNKVQFQRGLSDVEFERLYGTEEKCREALFSWRWPQGFACPACGGSAHCELDKRALWQCNACRTQTSLTAGTIFAATKLDLTVWFRAMFHMTQTKQGISALELSRRLDVSYNTAWAMHHKLRQVMLERNQDKPLDGRIEMDDAYLGGERSGGKRGRGSPGKTPFVAAVETTEDGKAHRVKLRRVRRFTKKNIKKITGRIVTRGARVATDGLGSSTASPTRVARTSRLSLAPAAGPRVTLHSRPSTRCSATSRAPSLPRSDPGARSTPRAGSQSSSTASTAAMIFPP